MTDLLLGAGWPVMGPFEVLIVIHFVAVLLLEVVSSEGRQETEVKRL